MYLPAVGLCIAVGAGLQNGIGLLKSGTQVASDSSACASRGAAGLWLRHWIGPAVSGAVVLVAAAFAFASYQQNPMWRDPISLFSTILKYNPDVDRVRHNLAMAYSDRGDDESALEQYRIVISHATGYPQTFHNVGEIFLRRKQFDQAKSYYEKAIAIDPRFFPSYRALAILYRQQGDELKAREYEEKALATQR
jgi:tetratricopeptide (TPR) repeat protein